LDLTPGIKETRKDKKRRQEIKHPLPELILPNVLINILTIFILSNWKKN
jgi:hypothetical protein